MKIRKVRHKGLRSFLEADDPSALPSGSVERIRNILSFLQSMADPRELRGIPGWKAHVLSGDRKGMWSVSVTRNWRITFRVDATGQDIVDLNYEDYR